MTTSTAIVKSITKLRPSGRSIYSPSSVFHSSSSAISSPAEPPSASSFQSPEKENRSGFSKWLLFLPGAITFGLGTWQIFRRQEKVKMLEYRQDRLGMEPLNCNSLFQPSEELDSLEFRKVTCRGGFDENKSIYVGPRSRSISGVTENGYYVITPLLPIPNDPDSIRSPILVNRGWVPRTWKERSLEVTHDAGQNSKHETHIVQQSERGSWWKFWTKKPKNIEDSVSTVSPVEVIGIVRGSEKPSIFVPPNEPSSNQWFYVDIPAIARTCGLPEDTIYVEDVNENVNPSNPYPLPKDVNTLIRSSVMPQDHLNYTLTWYSLSAAVTFMAFKRLRPKRSWR